MSVLILSSDKKYHPVLLILLTSNFSLLISTSACFLFSSNLTKLIKFTLASFTALFFLLGIFFTILFTCAAPHLGQGVEDLFKL